MGEPLDELYLQWLYEQVGRYKNRARTHWKLLGKMLQTEFVWLVMCDDNRYEDGRDLRYEFVQAAQVRSIDAAWMGMPCSVLEMLVALARRLDFEVEGPNWFWQLMENLGLSTFHDSHYDVYVGEVEETLSTLIWRTYRSNGEGGLFPLRYPEEDQRHVEIWYQMSAYLAEQAS